MNNHKQSKIVMVLAIVLMLLVTTGCVDSIQVRPGSTPIRYVTYSGVIYTGDLEGGGTDADVYLTLHGSLGNSREMHVDPPGSIFERGDRDRWGVEMKDIGDIQRVRIRHDNTGDRPGWFLEQIVIQNEDTRQQWRCSCNRWLARDEDDGKIERILQCN